MLGKSAKTAPSTFTVTMTMTYEELEILYNLMFPDLLRAYYERHNFDYRKFMKIVEDTESLRDLTYGNDLVNFMEPLYQIYQNTEVV